MKAKLITALALSWIFVLASSSRSEVVRNADELRRALATQPAGSEIVLADGRYYGEVLVPVRFSGTGAKPSIIRAANPWKAEIEPYGGDGDGVQVMPGSRYVVLEGLRIHGARLMGVRITQVENCTVRNCRIEMCSYSGILASGNGHTIDGCLIQRNGLTKWDHGVYVSGSRYLIYNNVIRGNFGWGIHAYNGRPGTVSLTNSLIVGNQAYDHKSVGILIWDGGNNLVFNNYSWGNARSNYQWEHPDPTNKIFGNFEVDPRRWPLRTIPEKTGGWPVPTAVIATSQPE